MAIEMAVFYTDGGCKQSQSVGGWGVHGYRYNTDVPKKGSGCPGHKPTSVGYVPNKDKETPAVTVIEYIDIVGTMLGEVTNNRAELMAYIKTLEYIARTDIMVAHILLDSEYVLKGVTKYMAKWIKSNWVSSTGAEVKNKDLWMMVIELLDSLTSTDNPVKLSYDWVKGHSGNPGNDLADLNATRGLVVASKYNSINTFTQSPPEGYWKQTAEYNRLIGPGVLFFFNSEDRVNKNELGYHPYYVYDPPQGWKMELFGICEPDACWSVIYTKEAEPIIDKIKGYQLRMDKQKLNSVCGIKLDNLFKPRIFNDIEDHGDTYLYPMYQSIDIHGAGKVPITIEFRPTRLSYRGMSHFEFAEHILRDYLNKEDHIIVTDVTDVFYETTEVKKKTKTKLKSTIDLAAKEIEVNIYCGLKGYDEQQQLVLIPGIYMPRRNTLSHIADNNPKIKVITWKESATAYCFATIVETDTDIGIWINPFTNVRLVTLK